jgi:hypothetical protein
MRIILRITILTFALSSIAPEALAQRGQPQTGQAAAPADLTGYWVSVVSEDWRHRMMTPRRGDFESIPGMTGEARRVANAWDLDQDNADGLQCKPFGVGGIIRQPGRLHITWADENTLQFDFDAGTQTRMLHFDDGATPPDELTWQGHSMAEWEQPPAGRGGNARAQIGNSTGPIAAGGGGRGTRGGPAPDIGVLNTGGSLRVETTGFREGYLRKNGVPYSENASITEYYHRLPQHPNGDNWLLVVTTIEDPTYLNQPFYTSTHFKLEADGSNFSPTPCRTAPPPGGGSPEPPGR